MVSIFSVKIELKLMLPHALTLNRLVSGPSKGLNSILLFIKGAKKRITTDLSYRIKVEVIDRCKYL